MLSTFSEVTKKSEDHEILGYMEKFFNNGTMTIKFHILNIHEWLGHAKDERCAKLATQLRKDIKSRRKTCSRHHLGQQIKIWQSQIF